MINDLNVSGVDDLWKYVDDSSISESVANNDPSVLQNHVDECTRKSELSWLVPNEGIQMQGASYKFFHV